MQEYFAHFYTPVLVADQKVVRRAVTTAPGAL